MAKKEKKVESSVTCDFNQFEMWDGGHCYLRATRDHEGYISISRFPNCISVEEFVKLAEWAKATVEVMD